MRFEYALSANEPDELDAILLSEAAPQEAMDITAVDGFPAAVLLNPGIIPPSQGLPSIGDRETARHRPPSLTLSRPRT